MIFLLLSMLICALGGQTEVVAVGSDGGGLYAEGSTSGSAPWMTGGPVSLFSEASVLRLDWMAQVPD